MSSDDLTRWELHAMIGLVAAQIAADEVGEIQLPAQSVEQLKTVYTKLSAQLSAIVDAEGEFLQGAEWDFEAGALSKSKTTTRDYCTVS